MIKTDSLIEEFREQLEANLKELTGIAWIVETRRDLWDFQFYCGVPGANTPRIATESHNIGRLDYNNLRRLVGVDARLVYVHYQRAKQKVGINEPA